MNKSLSLERGVAVDGGIVESLRRGLALLAAFDPADPELTLAELARRTNLPVPTTLRLLRTLVASGFVERNPRSRLYKLGMGAARLGYMGLDAFGPRDAAFPFLLDLHRRCSETVSMGVLVRTEVILVERFPSPDRVSSPYRIGSAIPAYCSAIGKVLLAETDRKEIRQLFSGYAFELRASRTVTSLDSFMVEIERAAATGIAFANEETSNGVRTVAAPVRNSAGAIVAGIAVSGATYRVTQRDIASRLAALCKSAADDVSSVLGYRRYSRRCSEPPSRPDRPPLESRRRGPQPGVNPGDF